MLACAMTANLPASPPIQRWPLPYEDLLDARPLAQIDLVVIHCTELPDLAMARDYGQRVLYPKFPDGRGTGNSGHYYLDRDGSTFEFVRPEAIAHHVRGYNPRALGIELVNTGRYPHWLDCRHQAMDEPYPPVQIDALIALLARLRTICPNLRQIAGHEDLDAEQVPASDDPTLRVARKRDPGPLFPWTRVLAATPLRPMAADDAAPRALPGS